MRKLFSKKNRRAWCVEMTPKQFRLGPDSKASARGGRLANALGELPPRGLERSPSRVSFESSDLEPGSQHANRGGFFQEFACGEQ